jgi:hypothetical protein
MNTTWIIVTFIALFAIQIFPGSSIIKALTTRWREELESSESERDSLQSAGQWIGILERLLIVTFVLAGQYSAIGFLIAAKSILRFGDKDSRFPRKQSEYILIGTLLSFSYAVYTAIIAVKIAGIHI